MLIIPGGGALSGHQAAKMLERLQRVVPDCCAVDACFIHFAKTTGALGTAQKKLLEPLLRYGESRRESRRESSDPATAHAFTRVVTPRIGTISPWSTKATDILHHCGLEAVARIERGVEWRIHFSKKPHPSVADWVAPRIHDQMTESVLPDRDAAQALFQHADPLPVAVVNILGGGLQALEKADAEFGFALSAPERKYLVAQFIALGRNPTDAELMMFAQVNSEHCRHKIFNADWRIDGQPAGQSPFDMIRHTHRLNGAGTLVAYKDNAAVLEGVEAQRFQANPRTGIYAYLGEAAHLVAKVETHNHPTAISPFAGAATGSGGEIRDEGATGRGGKPKAGMVGYSVSHLRLPGCPRPWEGDENKPARIAAPLRIMLEAPIGAAAFNNEFGRPVITGYFRTFEQVPAGGDGAFRHGYHKPIMLAGGLGNIRPALVRKARIADGTPIVVLGGPAMGIGLGGGAASSVASGDSSESLDYASVQRGNPEMQRRCQEVIDACCALGEDSPILSIHDVGAGGLCNALPELVHDSERGGVFELREVRNDEPGMSPMQIWCNESQERYVLAIEASRLSEFERICERERCLYATLGRAVAARKLTLRDRYFAGQGAPRETPIDLDMAVLFGLPPKMLRDVSVLPKTTTKLRFDAMSVERAAELVLGFPAVADKTFLVTIGDRSVGGLIAREQMVGPWQVPVADVGVAADGYRGHSGAAMAVGERTPLAVLDAAAAGRMAVSEAITNIAAAPIAAIGDLKLSANWMVAAGEPGHDADLFAAVRAVAMELCPQLGISIPVGKDSMSMKSVWRDRNHRQCKAVSPVSLIITAFAPLNDVRDTLTPQLQTGHENDLWLLDLGRGANRLGGSALAQATAQLGDAPPDMTDANCLKGFFELIQSLNGQGHLLAYHDRSDGGLMATLCEMAFASRCGLAIELSALADDPLAVLFNEEAGAVIQTARRARDSVLAEIRRFGLQGAAHIIGQAVTGHQLSIEAHGKTWLRNSRMALHRIWAETTWRMQSLRDNPECADQEYARIDDHDDPGLFSRLSFDHPTDTSAPYLCVASRPKIAILREQGVNGQLEMAAAFDCAGFEAVDVTMSDLSADKSLSLEDYKGLAACGGFSFGDVLGGGEGWGKSILYNPRLRAQFAAFFARQDTFALGVCNGCQMLAAIKELVPGAAHWPRFTRNHSEQYEARVAMVEICSDKSVLLRGMKGSMLPISTAHGEGRAKFHGNHLTLLENHDQIGLRFVDNRGHTCETYPANPNGSPGGATGFTNDDGRITIMMPHPERVFRTACNSWHPTGPAHWGDYSPWIQIFKNARAWVD